QALPQFGYPHRWTGNSWDAADWTKWAEYNKISAPHRLAGHSWQVFIQQNAELLKQNPQFLAEIKGVRLGYGKTSKLCISNKQLQKAFVQNALDRFAKQADFTGYISVEPSDGAGHCECSECKKMGSISNRVFSLANITAKAIRKKYPKGGVNLYAYNEHADTPSIRLEPNVHVTVIPNGFQGLYDGDVLLYLWKNKTDNLSYYDYFAIPQWKGELPRIHIQNFVRKIAIAKKLNYKGFWHETGFSLPATIALQLMSQIWRDPSLSWEEVYDNFITDCFPNARIPMKRLFDRWFNEWNEDNEVSMAYDDIKEAETKQLTADEKKRLADIKAYTFYIAAYQQWRRNETPETTKQFFNEVFSIAGKQVVNTSALFQLFGTKIKNPTVQKQYNLLSNKDWKWMSSWSDKSIDNNLSNYYRLSKNNASSKKTISAKAINKGKSISFKDFNTVILEGTGQPIDLFIKGVDFANRKDGLQYISVIAENGDLVFNGLNPIEKKIRFSSKKNMAYRISVKQVFYSFLTINTEGVKAVIE
ncbi:MAG TPA: DUF4838 domain-containing protein, partial [Chitinophagaceae bacterium]|nr:DUF4838 domain-containing protein [Chitinophagaceae bacterium]